MPWKDLGDELAFATDREGALIEVAAVANDLLLVELLRRDLVLMLANWRY